MSVSTESLGSVPMPTELSTKRRHHKKSKTGCFTCKARRVKCTEEKPECMRCIRSRRVCEGYPQEVHDDAYFVASSSKLSLVRAKGTSSLSEPLSNYYGDVDFSSLELQSLQYFHFKTVPALCGFFDSKFWRRLLLQLSHSEPSLRCAMMAIGSAQRSNEQVGGFQSLDLDENVTPVDHDPFTLHQYTKAINLVQKRLSGGVQSRMVSLVACILFVCLELQRGQRRTALSHLRCGISMLSSVEQSLAAYASMNASDTPRDMIENDIAPIISRLSLLQTLYRQPRSDLFVGTLNVTTPEDKNQAGRPFKSLELARIACHNLGNSSLRFSHMVLARLFPDLESRECFRNSHMRRLQEWSDSFEEYMSFELYQQAPSITKEMRGPAVLRISNSMAVAWTKFIDSPLNEMDADNLMDYFTLITNMAERIIEATERDCPEEGGPAAFSLDNGLIPPLFFVAMKCRNRVLRRRAIDLLYRSPWRREGVWDATTAAKLGELHFAVEEESVAPGSEELPSFQNRIMDVELHLRDAKTPNRQLVTFRFPPRHPGQVAFFRREYMYFDSAEGVPPAIEPSSMPRLLGSLPGPTGDDSNTLAQYPNTSYQGTPDDSSYLYTGQYCTDSQSYPVHTGFTESFMNNAADYSFLGPEEGLNTDLSVLTDGLGPTTSIKSYQNSTILVGDWLDGTVAQSAPAASLTHTPPFGQSLVGLVR